MVRKLVITFVAVAIILGGFGGPGGMLLGAAKASDDPMAMSDCANMMSMSGGQDAMDCPAMSDQGDQNLPTKCTFKDCLQRSCSVSAFQITVSPISYTLLVGLPEPWPDDPAELLAAGKPPLPPPRSSILA